MSSILGLVRIAAVVGLSAIKVISTCLKVKEAKEMGVINPLAYVINNGNPYNQPMNNNMVCGSTVNQFNSDLRWRDNTCDMSRRNMDIVPVITQPQVYVPQPQPVQIQQPVQQTIPMPVYNYQQPVMNTIDYVSRRWNNYQYPNQMPVYQSWNQTYQPQHVQHELQWKNYSLGGINNYNTNHFNMMGGNNQHYYGNELRWQQPTYRGISNLNYGGNNIRPWKPIFDWNSIWLRNPRQLQYDSNGAVAMFYTDDGTPLFGPVS